MARPKKPEGTTADRIIAIRLTPTDEALLACVVDSNEDRVEAAELSGRVSASEVVRTLIRREAARVGGLSAASTLGTLPASPEDLADEPAPAIAQPSPYSEDEPIPYRLTDTDDRDNLIARIAVQYERAARHVRKAAKLEKRLAKVAQ